MSKCIKDVKFLDGQGIGCPDEVKKELHQIWINWELGNDFYFITWDWKEMGDDYPAINKFLISQGLNESNKVILHWWW